MKKVAVCLEHRFFEYDNNIYTKLSFPYTYWKDYLNYFDEVTIIARVQKVSQLEANMVLVSGNGVKYEKLPYYIGIKQFVFKLPALIPKITTISLKYNRFILRSGNATNILALHLIFLRKPYLREYPGNIKEGVLGFAGSSHRMIVLANFLDSIAKLQAKFSRANSFVSKYCKDLYASKRPSFIFSSFKESEISKSKTNYLISDRCRIVTVGRLEGEKGHIDLLKTIEEFGLQDKFEIHLIGDGSQKKSLEVFSVNNGINATFYGSMTNRAALFNLLASSDIFVLPSHTEGMPRALLEAMAVGLPCIATNVGGIPEVLPNEVLYEPKSSEKLKALLEDLLNSTTLRQKLGKSNREFIQNHYSDKVLETKKYEFWGKLYE